MPSTINYRAGDILLIPFPFTDLSSQKKRSCIIISSSEFNNFHPDLILAAITSQIPVEISSTEYLLSKKEQLTCGLPKPSLVKLGKIVTLDKRLIRKRLGSLPPASTKKVLTKIKKIFKL